jgi:hypothetical protein
VLSTIMFWFDFLSNSIPSSSTFSKKISFYFASVYPPWISFMIKSCKYLQMAREMDEILRQQIAQTANSCTSENGVSFLDHVILPLYDVISAVSLRVQLTFYLILQCQSWNKFCTPIVDDAHNFMLWICIKSSNYIYEYAWPLISVIWIEDSEYIHSGEHTGPLILSSHWFGGTKRF